MVGGSQHNPQGRDTMASAQQGPKAKLRRCLEALGCTDTREREAEIGPGRMTFRLNAVDYRIASETALSCGARRTAEWGPGVIMVALV